KLVAHPGRELELELIGCVAHSLLEPLNDRIVLAVEEVEEVAHELVVVLVVDVVDAGRGAFLDVCVEARAAESTMPVERRLGACPDREGTQEEVERLADR